MAKKTKEKPKGPICPILSQIFYVQALQFQGESYTFPGDPRQPQYEIRTATWHCEREKCAWWIPKFKLNTNVAATKRKPLTIPTGKGWCGKIAPPRGPAK